jgi:large subunit ribosomal protein L24
MSKKLKVKDEVMVITGNCKGQKGKILFRSGDKVVVEGINLRKKHRKPTRQNEKGQIIDMECPIHVSNIKLYKNA